VPEEPALALFDAVVDVHCAAHNEGSYVLDT